MSDCEIPEFYTETRHVARKQHKCCECRKHIEPGEPYMACRGKWDGEMNCYKQHLPCYHVSRLVNLPPPGPYDWKYYQSTRVWGIQLGYEDCIGFGDIEEELRESSSGWDDESERYEIPFGVEQCVNIQGFWDAWLSGVKERFEDGAGI